MDYLSRETVRLHDERLPLVHGAEAFPDGVHPFSVLKRDDDRVGPHVWTVLLSDAALRRQFETEPDEGPHFGFQLRPSAAGGKGLLPRRCRSLRIQVRLGPSPGPG